MNIFEEADKKGNFKFKKSRLEEANKAGFNYISEYVVKIYREEKSLRKTGEICSNISSIAVSSILKLCNEPTRKQGGKVWSKLTESDIDLIRSYSYMNLRISKKLSKLISKRASEREGKKISITPTTIKNAWMKKTHKEA